MKALRTIAFAVSSSVLWAGLLHAQAPNPAPIVAPPGADQAAPPANEPMLKVAKETIIEIESKFFEIPEEEAKRLGLLSATMAFVPDDRAGAKQPANEQAIAPGVDAVLAPDAAARLLKKLHEAKGVNLLSAPRVTTRTGQRATIEVIREFRYPTEFDFDKGSKVITPTAFETRNIGVTLEVEPRATNEGVIEFQVTPQVVKLEGYMRASDGQPVPLRNGRGVGADMTLQDLAPVKTPTDTVLQPLFSTNRLNANLSLYSGDTVVLGGLRKDVHEEGKARVSQLLYVLVTVRLINHRPGAERVLPVAFLNKADKEGFVRSPYAPEANPIDARGLPPGTELKCPATKQLFRLP